MLKVKTDASPLRRVTAAAAAVLIPQDTAGFSAVLKELRPLFGKRLDRLVELRAFKGKERDLLVLDTERHIAAHWLILVGVGTLPDAPAERLRRAAAAAANQARTLDCKSVAIVLPSDAALKGRCTAEAAAVALAEGAYLSQYRYDKYQSKKEKKPGLSEILLLLPDAASLRSAKKPVADAMTVCRGTVLARDLENAPPNELYPETLAAAAREAAARSGLRCTVWDKKKIEQAGFGGLLAVNAGSDRPARFIILEHNAGRKDLKNVALIGKGVTFDAGGISIKPAAGMSEMKMDMSGAAAVLATMETAAHLKLPVRLVGLIPATENLLGGSAMRPGDIITHYGGTTSEVDNTDAEGRLILADALAFAASTHPDVMIDLATLTGACVVALGMHATGMMGNDDETMAALKAAGEATFERVWQLPLFEEYEKQIKSDVADVKNVGGRWAGAITAALFLKKFVGSTKWVHLDIAGTAILEDALPYAPKGGSGVGVRLLIEYLKRLS